MESYEGQEYEGTDLTSDHNVTVEISVLSIFTHHGVSDAEQSTERSYRTLERLCTAVADMLHDRFGATRLVVRGTKPEPPIPLRVEEVTVEVTR
jgi:dihydroneopterin aldolase